MAPTPTAQLRLRKQGIGDNNNTWGEKLNATLDNIDMSIAGYVELTTTGGTTVLTVEDYLPDQDRAPVLIVKGTLTTNATIVVAQKFRTLLVDNQTSGAFSVTVSTGAGINAAVAQGEHEFVYVRGPDVLLASAAADVNQIQADLANKADANHTHTPAQVGLANVDNTSDANKPISIATQNALDDKYGVDSAGTQNFVLGFTGDGTGLVEKELVVGPQLELVHSDTSIIIRHKERVVTRLSVNAKAGETVTINRIDIPTGKSVTIDWGDGSPTVTLTGTNQTASHTYAADFAGEVEFSSDDLTHMPTRFEIQGPWRFGLERVTHWPLTRLVASGALPKITGSLANLPDEMVTLTLNFTASEVTGELTDLPANMDSVNINSTNSVLTGALADAPTSLRTIAANDTPSVITGDLNTAHPALRYLSLTNTQSAITGNIDNAPTSMIFLSVANTQSVIGGNIAAAPANMQNISVGNTQSTLGGNIAGAPAALRYLSVIFSQAAITGNLSLAPAGLEFFGAQNSQSNVNATAALPANLNTLTINGVPNALAQVRIDNILAQLAAGSVNNGEVNLSAPHPAPSAGAAANIATLQGRGWTVTVTP